VISMGFYLALNYLLKQLFLCNKKTGGLKQRPVEQVQQ
jgi:hypothetical protein